MNYKLLLLLYEFINDFAEEKKTINNEDNFKFKPYPT